MRQEERRASSVTMPTRRGLIKGAAVAGVAAATVPAMAAAEEAQADAPAAEAPRPLVVESDILIIGGGVSGLTAARTALAGGGHVVIVDKGPWGNCGTSGINWGHDIETNEWFSGNMEDVMAAYVTTNDGLMNQAYGIHVWEGLRAARPAAYAEQVGIVLQRVEGGVSAAMNADTPLTIDHGYFLRWHARDIRLKGAEVHDRTFILDLIRDESGRAAGAVGIDLISGDPVVFHAKSVVLAAGAYLWAAGYNGQGAYSIGSPENTGDGYRMLLDAGVSFADMEHMVTDIAQWTPKGNRQGMGGICGSTPTHEHIVDKDLNRVTELFEQGGGYPEFFRNLVKAELDGRAVEVEGADVGGFYVDIDGIGLPNWNRYYARVPENYKLALDYDLPRYVLDVYSQWDCCGKPSKLDEHGQTEIPGVFFAGATEGAAFMYACGSGWIAGEGAAQLASETEIAPAIPWDQVESLLGNAYGILDATPDEPIRALEVFRRAQKAYWTGLKPLRDAESLQACIDECDRIEAEDLPRMCVASKSRRFNTDWVLALEVKSILRVAKASALSALAREETRGYHCRVDFPKMDNENWLKNVNVCCVDGQWRVEATDIDGTYVPAEVIKAMLVPYGLE